jgi:hypothetical protein
VRKDDTKCCKKTLLFSPSVPWILVCIQAVLERTSLLIPFSLINITYLAIKSYIN